MASRTLQKLDWNNSELIRGDVSTEIKKLKESAGPEIQVHGSGSLIQTLLRNDLVDEFWLKIFPVTLGKGKRLFAEGTIPAGLRLLESEITPNGVIVAKHARAGEVKIGDAQLESPSAAELERRRKLSDE